jgi:hypothetical protein
MYQMRKLKSVLTTKSGFEIRFRNRIAHIIICAILFLSCDSISAKVIHQVHPPPVQILPRPPQQLLEKAYFYRWESKDVVKALKDTGMEIVDVKGGITIGATAAVESTVFLIPSYGEGIGGAVSSYDSENKLNESIKYYSAMNKDPQAPAWWIFKRDNILLLISGKVPEKKAMAYEKALHGMGKK